VTLEKHCLQSEEVKGQGHKVTQRFGSKSVIAQKRGVSCQLQTWWEYPPLVVHSVTYFQDHYVD